MTCKKSKGPIQWTLYEIKDWEAPGRFALVYDGARPDHPWALGPVSEYHTEDWLKQELPKEAILCQDKHDPSEWDYDTLLEVIELADIDFICRKVPVS